MDLEHPIFGLHVLGLTLEVEFLQLRASLALPGRLVSPEVALGQVTEYLLGVHLLLHYGKICLLGAPVKVLHIKLAERVAFPIEELVLGDLFVLNRDLLPFYGFAGLLRVPGALKLGFERRQGERVFVGRHDRLIYT